MITDDLMAEILAHALAESPRECCGLIVNNTYIPCKNLAESPFENFILCPQDFAEAEDAGEVQTIVHSHPFANPAPSQADLVGLEASQLPWLIVNPQTGSHTLTHPTGYRAPLLGREFSYGVLDCYALGRDWYAERGIELPDFERSSFGWWDRGENLFLDGFRAAGFEKIALEDLRYGDAILMQITGSVPNHCAVYLGDNLILHHLTKRLSAQDVYGGYYLKHTSHALRHKDMKR